jgi:hypothetical protein
MVAVAVEADLGGRTHEKLNRVRVIEDPSAPRSGPCLRPADNSGNPQEARSPLPLESWGYRLTRPRKATEGLRNARSGFKGQSNGHPQPARHARQQPAIRSGRAGTAPEHRPRHQRVGLSPACTIAGVSTKAASTKMAASRGQVAVRTLILIKCGAAVSVLSHRDRRKCHAAIVQFVQLLGQFISA